MQTGYLSKSDFDAQTTGQPIQNWLLDVGAFTPKGKPRTGRRYLAYVLQLQIVGPQAGYDVDEASVMGCDAILGVL